jgi:hypothetical protein
MARIEAMTNQEIDKLKDHSRMLGRIAAWVSDFCDEEESTTEEAVLRLLDKYHSLAASLAGRGASRKKQTMTTEQLALSLLMSPEAAECTLRYLLSVGPVDAVVFHNLSLVIVKDRLNLCIIQNKEGDYKRIGTT